MNSWRRHSDRTLHLRIAEYFQTGVSASIAGSGTVPARQAAELAYQLHAGGAIDRLCECLSTIPVFTSMYQGETLYDLLKYWSELGEAHDVEALYRRGLEQWAIDDPGERSRGMGQVADLLKQLGRWGGAIELQRKRSALATARGDRREEACSRQRLGFLLVLRGEFAEALKEVSLALELHTALGDHDGMSTAIGSLGVVYASRDAYESHVRSPHFHGARQHGHCVP